ncbi:MAG: TIGR03987 family protein, partial [Thermotogota bacterium]|nr:TIGR03987 family protein [Thermotogota bacterium]
MLITAIITISLALVFYTSGVFMERKRGMLSVFHTILFGLGLVFDATGTLIMGQIAQSSME